jgi:hypothetical protein
MVQEYIGDLPHGGHGHAHGIGLLSVLEYGAAVKDKKTLAFVRTGYEWIKANGSSLTGFFPEVLAPGYQRSETLAGDAGAGEPDQRSRGREECWGVCRLVDGE